MPFLGRKMNVCFKLWVSIKRCLQISQMFKNNIAAIFTM